MATDDRRKKRSAGAKNVSAASGPQEPVGPRLARTTAPRQLDDPAKRAEWGLPALDDRDSTGSYIVELNVQHASGLPGAAAAFRELFDRYVAPNDNAKGERTRVPEQISKAYFRCNFTDPEWRLIVHDDESRPIFERSIYRLWPDFPVSTTTDRSVSTIKADAALRSFDAAGENIVWAVVDSGVDATHAHFGPSDAAPGAKDHLLLSSDVADLHRSFTSTPREMAQRGVLPSPDWNLPLQEDERERLLEKHRALALSDDFGHGTHVAGIIAGQAPEKKTAVCALERQFGIDETGLKSSERFAPRPLSTHRPRGIAPRCRLISLRVLDAAGEGRTSDVIRALEYIREKVNDNPKFMRVHGVNLSVGYAYDPEMYGVGQSPICVAVDGLVQQGLVVVVAAGNTGYGALSVNGRNTQLHISNSINDPGNSFHAITVGSTHRDSPHTYGVSYFSSKGPTGDGRLKPDLVAPGERITSCAAGAKLTGVLQGLPSGAKKGVAYYMDDSGTSMAAPHVSGAIAAFLSVRREFIGKPQEVKRIFLDSATPLGRERYFEGHGLVDLMRALQSV